MGRIDAGLRARWRSRQDHRRVRFGRFHQQDLVAQVRDLVLEDDLGIRFGGVSDSHFGCELCDRLVGVFPIPMGVGS